MAGAELRAGDVRGLVPARSGASLPRTGSRRPRAGPPVHGAARAVHAGAGGQRHDRPGGQDPVLHRPGPRRDRRVRDQDSDRVRRTRAEPVQLHPRHRAGHQPGRQPHRAALRRAVHRRADAAQALRHAGAEAAIPPSARAGRGLRLRAHREPRRLRSGRARHHGDAVGGRAPLHPQRREALVHQRHHRRADGGDGPHRTEEDHRLHRRGRLAGRGSGRSGSTSWASRRSRTASSGSPT